LSGWREGAIKDILDIKAKAKIDGRKRDQKYKEQAVNRVNKIIKDRSEAKKGERLATRLIKKEGNKLTEIIANDNSMNKKQKMMTADEVNTQVKAAITEINSKEFPRMRPATVMCDLVQAVDGTSVTTNDQQEIEKVHITNEDIERLRKLFPPPRNLEKFEWAVEALEKSREMMQTDADEE